MYSFPFLSALGRALAPYRDRRMLTLLALGFSSGLPAPLVFSNLSIWLRDEGVSRTDIGLFALAATPYAINFLWAPLIDRLRLPYLTARLGRRRSWALLMQSFLILAILVLSFAQPSQQLWMMALAVLFVTFISATQDIVIDAYRIEILEPEKYGSGSAVGIWGWHLGGTLVGGAGGLYLAQALGWNMAYLLLATGVLIGMTAVLLSPEPQVPASQVHAQETAKADRYLQDKGAIFTAQTSGGLVLCHTSGPSLGFYAPSGLVTDSDFLSLSLSWGDALLGRMSGVFYRELGFSLGEIAEVAKVYGLTANLIGIVVGGVLVARIGLLRALFLSGFATAATNLTYSWLAVSGQSTAVFIFAVASDSFTTGLVTVALVAYLSSLCNTAYTATQYALLASLANLARIWFSASSGMMVDALDGDWGLFFLLCALIALLGLPLLYWIMKRYPESGRA